MNPAAPLADLVVAYQTFEQQVREVVTGVCRSHCVACVKRCCRNEYCGEALENPWLRRVRGCGEGSPRYDPLRGWLGDSGCRLDVGRPPVCYEFYCSAILSGMEPATKYAALVAGKLVSFVGRKALGNRHLVELSEDELRERLRPERVRRRIDEGYAILEICREALASKRLDDGAFPCRSPSGGRLPPWMKAVMPFPAAFSSESA